MKYLLPLLAVFIFTSCNNEHGSQTYDIPPTPPIPPEKYCFESDAGNGAASTRLELIVEGDSASGKVDYAKTENIPSGEFKGVVFGTTLIIKYKFKTDTGVVTQEQEWNLVEGNISRKIVTQIPDSLSGGKRVIRQVSETPPLHKVPCK